MRNSPPLGKKSLLVGLLVLIVLGVLGGELFLYQRGKNPVVTQKQQKPFNVQEVDHKVDAMFADWHAHVKKAGQYCDKHDIWGPRRVEIITAQHNVGKAEFEKVRQSGYTLPYEPKYPPLPTD